MNTQKNESTFSEGKLSPEATEFLNTARDLSNDEKIADLIYLALVHAYAKGTTEGATEQLDRMLPVELESLKRRIVSLEFMKEVRELIGEDKVKELYYKCNERVFGKDSKYQ